MIQNLRQRGRAGGSQTPPLQATKVPLLKLDITASTAGRFRTKSGMTEKGENDERERTTGRAGFKPAPTIE